MISDARESDLLMLLDDVTESGTLYLRPNQPNTYFLGEGPLRNEQEEGWLEDESFWQYTYTDETTKNNNNNYYWAKTSPSFR